MKESKLSKTGLLQSVSTIELSQAGQSPWLDNISRELLKSGRLKELIEDFGLLGVTSNPSIFEKSISQKNGGYDRDILKFVRKGLPTLQIYDELTLSDIRSACDFFRKVHQSSKGEHGYVSLEVLPTLAYEEERTASEAIRLFKAVSRPNVMIKVPATPEGVRAVRRLIGNGININVTLMFSRKHYRDVANAYIDGLADFKRKGGDPSRVHSVASVFVSRIDNWIDKKLDERIKTAGSAEKEKLEALKGKAAIANSKLIYQDFKEIFASDKFKKLKAAGAFYQKVLWGSTSTKNPNYPDLLYVEPLIGRETVNTMPTATLEAFMDHGKVYFDSIEEGVDSAYRTVSEIESLGFSFEKLGEVLQKDGVKAFSDSFDSLMGTLEKKRTPAIKNEYRPVLKVVLPPQVQKLVKQSLAAADTNLWVKKLLAGDPDLWTKDLAHHKVIRERMGWLRSCEWILGKLYLLDELRQEALRERVRSVVLLGMGGSSLAPEVCDLVLRRPGSKPRFFILDTTDPAGIRAIENAIDYRSTWFIVASKSGGTIETTSQLSFFYDRAKTKLKAKASEHFIAITDSGSPLQALANENRFRKVFLNPADIGGRYSALSFFGLVPAALAGIDFRRLVFNARRAYEDLSQAQSVSKQGACYLGVVLGVLAKEGFNKLSLWAEPALRPFGAWLEQLIAESTGKEGKGIIPIDEDSPTDTSCLGSGRVVLRIGLKSSKKQLSSSHVSPTALKKRGIPVIELMWPSAYTLGAEFLNWEIATAMTSAILEVDPFDEPNVEESKLVTGRLLSVLESQGSLEAPRNLVSFSGVVGKNGSEDLRKPLSMLLNQIQKDGYLSILAFIERSAENGRLLAQLQVTLRDALKVPVLTGFGPRYLHSIGQLYKGGPANGAFLFVIGEDPKDFRIPGKIYSFGQLKSAQAYGDLEAIQKRKFPVLPIKLKGKTAVLLKEFNKAVHGLVSQ